MRGEGGEKVYDDENGQGNPPNFQFQFLPVQIFKMSSSSYCSVETPPQHPHSLIWVFDFFHQNRIKWETFLRPCLIIIFVNLFIIFFFLPPSPPPSSPHSTNVLVGGNIKAIKWIIWRDFILYWMSSWFLWIAMLLSKLSFCHFRN